LKRGRRETGKGEERRTKARKRTRYSLGLPISPLPPVLSYLNIIQGNPAGE
jgi:hypothetical protein